jgi:hypothetical protein
MSQQQYNCAQCGCLLFGPLMTADKGGQWVQYSQSDPYLVTATKFTNYCLDCDQANLAIEEKARTKRRMQFFLQYLDRASEVIVPQSWDDVLEEAKTKIRATPAYLAYLDQTG